MRLVVQLLGHVRLFAIPWTAACQAPKSTAISLSLLKFISIELVILYNHLILCHPLPHLSSIFPSSGCQSIGASASSSVLPKNWRLISFRLTGVTSLESKGLSRVFSSTTTWKLQFFGAQPSLWSNFHICMWILEKQYLWLYGTMLSK